MTLVDQCDIDFNTPDLEVVPRPLIDAAKMCFQEQPIKHAPVRREAEKVIKEQFSELRKLIGEGEAVCRAKEWAASRAEHILHELSVHMRHKNGFYSSLRSSDKPDEATLNRVVEAIDFTQKDKPGMTASEDDILTKEFWKCCDAELRHELVWNTGETACLKVGSPFCALL